MTTRPTHARPRRRQLSRLGATLTTLALLTAACAAGNDAATTTTTTTTTAVTASTTTTTAPVTTAPPTTTGPTYSDVEIAIRDAHTRVMTELFARDERVTPPETILPLAEQLVIDPMLQRIRDSVADKARTGEYTVGQGYESNITEVRIIDDTNAWVFDCSRGTGEGYAADGELLVPADDDFKIRQSVMTLVNGRWMVGDIYSGGDNRCDPGE